MEITQEEMKHKLHENALDVFVKVQPFYKSTSESVADLQEAKSSAKKLIEKIDDYLETLNPKFKVGDIVSSEIFIDGSGIVRLEEDLTNDFSGIEGLWYIKKDCEIKDTAFGVVNKKTRHATPEEIAEYEAALNFHKHGRGPFEIKEGDILRDDKGNIFFVGFPNNFKKEYFTRGIYTFLKTAEEYNEWLGVSDE